MVTAPSDLMRDVYGWGTPAYDATALVVNVGAVLQHIAVDVRRRELGALPLRRLHGGTPPAHPPMTQLFLPLVGSDVAGSSEAGLTVFGLPPTTAGGARRRARRRPVRARHRRAAGAPEQPALGGSRRRRRPRDRDRPPAARRAATPTCGPVSTPRARAARPRAPR